MKTILLAILIILITLTIQAQTYPIQQNLGAATTLVKNPNYGGTQGGLVPFSFSDTISANTALTYLKNYGGAIIYTTDCSCMWFRDLANTKWVQFLPSGSPLGANAWLIGGNNSNNADPDSLQFGNINHRNIYFITNDLKRFALHRDGIQPNTADVLNLGINSVTGFLAYGSSGTSTNIYNTDGTLTADRTLDGNGTRSLTFDNLTSFNVNDATNNRIVIDNTQSILFSPNNSRYFTVNNGSTGIVGLANLSSQTRLIGQDGSNSAIGYVTFGSGVSLVAGVLSATGTGGTVTSIATTSPITGGTINTTGTIACATCVVSAAALTANSLVIGGGLQATSVTTTATGMLTFLGTPSSANLAATMTDETGTGLNVFGTSPSFVTSVIGGASMDIFNTVTTTANLLKAATTVNMMASAGVLNFGGGATAAELRFLEPSASGTNYSAFKAVAQGSNITYSLPPTVGAAGTVLTDVAGNGVLTWAAASSFALTNGSGTTANGTAVDLGGTATGNIAINMAGNTFEIPNQNAGLILDPANQLIKIGDYALFNNGNYISVVDNSNFFIYDNSVHDGKFGINTATPTEALDVNGNIIASGTITPSSRKYKMFINPLNNGLQTLMKLEPKTFYYDQEKYPNKNFNKGKQYGLIAEDVRDIIPEIVKTYPDGFAGINYTEIIPILISANISMEKQILELQKQVKKLQKK